MIKKQYPILEFDAISKNFVPIKKNITQEVLPARCVISFLGDAVKSLVEDKKCEIIGKLKLESFVLPIYAVQSLDGEMVALIHGFGSGPYAAGQVEKLLAMGCNKFMVCGGCGVMNPDSTCGELLVPTIAIRDEGTSYHYVPPSREIGINEDIKKVICEFLEKENIPFKCVKTWTTDAMYRETVDKISLRREEGCDIVEMECASFYAIAQYKKVPIGLLLYAGDDLSGEKWNSRNWKAAADIRRYLLELCLDICRCV